MTFQVGDTVVRHAIVEDWDKGYGMVQGQKYTVLEMRPLTGSLVLEGAFGSWNRLNFTKVYEQMNKPHKHAAIIKAWADGCPVQVRSPNSDYKWVDLIVETPIWSTKCDYRVKPEPKPDRVVSVQVQELSGKTIIVGLNTPDNLKLVFDGETGELKRAIVL